MKKVAITQDLCRMVELMLKGGAQQKEVGERLGISKATVSRIKAAGFSAEVYRQNQLKQKAKKPEVVLTINHEELAGQMEMDLQAAEEPKTEMSEQTRLMRFQAAQADKICEKITKQAVIINETMMVKLDRINDTLCQILRAVRKE